MLYSKKKSFLLLIFTPFLAFSCQLNSALNPQPEIRPLDALKGATPEIQEEVRTNSIKKEAFTLKDGEAVYKFLMYTIESKALSASIHYQNPPLSLPEWQNKLKANLLINAGYFSEDFLPLGFTKINGKIITKESFRAASVGSVFISPDHQVHLFGVKEKLPEQNSLIQAYPVLLQNGKNQIQEDTGLLARRTVIAKNKNDEVVILLVDQTPISLFQLGKLLDEQRPELDFALNLDGGASTGLILNANGHQETILPLTPLPVVVAWQEPTAR